MEILGIGPLELLFILIIALVILGPGDMVKAGRTLGRLLRKVITSSEYRMIQKASQELKYIPNRLMREATLEDLSNELKDINKIGAELNTEIKKVEVDLSSWTTPPDQMENNILGNIDTSPETAAPGEAPPIDPEPRSDESATSFDEKTSGSGITVEPRTPHEGE